MDGRKIRGFSVQPTREFNRIDWTMKLLLTMTSCIEWSPIYGWDGFQKEHIGSVFLTMWYVPFGNHLAHTLRRTRPQRRACTGTSAHAAVYPGADLQTQYVCNVCHPGWHASETAPGIPPIPPVQLDACLTHRPMVQLAPKKVKFMGKKIWWIETLSMCLSVTILSMPTGLITENS